MRGLTTTVAAVLAAATGVVAADNSTCARGLHIIVARGTTELKGSGVSGLLADKIAAQVKDSVIEPLDYPATFTDPGYPDSVTDGVKDMQDLLDKYTDRCPDGKVAILGYSQGAQVTMDSICGGVGSGFDNATALDAKKVKNNIVAIVIYGDPTHRANVTYDKGTSVNNGVFARSNASVEVCTGYADRLVSYCDTGDVYCDNGKDKAVHGTYVLKYGDEIVKYIVDKYNAATNNGSSSSNSTTTGGSSTATATATTAAPTGSASTTASGTTTGGAAATTTAAKTAGASVVSGGLYLGVPLALLAVFQAL